jgi:hypothetical protein
LVLRAAAPLIGMSRPFFKSMLFDIIITVLSIFEKPPRI